MNRYDVTALARTLGLASTRRSVMIATAESCTGGGVAEAMTRVPGSSSWFDRAFVTYTNTAKVEMLGVSRITLERHGAVSEQVAGEMAEGALAFSHADLSVAVTGIAGPGGGTPQKPVGLVYIAWAVRGGEVQMRQFHFSGPRDAVRGQSVAFSIQGLIDILA